MLLRFGTSNFRSVWDYQELSLVATSLKDDGPDLLQPSAIREAVLPAAAIYGANASGKTTMIKALERLSTIVEHSHATGNPNSKFPRSRFALSESAVNRPTRFDVDFILEETRYHYGVEVFDDRVSSEWLYAFNGPYKNVWFERKSGTPISFGRSLRGRNRLIEEITRTNSLFLSAAAQNAHDQLTPIFAYLTSSLKFRVQNASDMDAFRLARDGEIDSRAVDFLRFADTGIVQAKLEDIPHTERSQKLLEGLQKVFSENLDDSNVNMSFDRQIRQLKLGHNSENGAVIFLDSDQESRGTVKLMNIISEVYRCLDDGSVLIIDELDNSLHTVLARQVVELFSRRETNPIGAQILFTTHDTNLMRGGLFRRDQIWLCEKDQTGQTCVYPLSDIRVRATDNLERGYLQGRFGAIPFLGADGVLKPAEPATA